MSLVPRLGPELPEECRATYARHFAFAVLDAFAAGILTNAPLMALKGMGSREWQVAVQLPISSLGMFAVLYLGGIMAGRAPMPFAVVPGLAFAATSLLMALTDQPLLFLILFGMGTLFETISRPAVTAIIRLNYPATHRGAVTGAIRQWHLITVMATGALAAWALDQAKGTSLPMIQVQMLLAAAVSTLSFLVFRTIRVRGYQGEEPAAPEVSRPLRDAWEILRRDRRFRVYLGIGFLYSFGALIYVSYVPVLFTRRLHFGYLLATFLTTTLPNLMAILCTARIGRWVDRVNPWKAWSTIRLGWGLDPILLAGAAGLAGLHPAFALVPSLLGRVSRGLVMGGSWILWWQVGVNHFAKPGGDTTRYMGMVLFVNGFSRLLGPSLGAWMLAAGCPLGSILCIGGGLVLLSSLLSYAQHLRERGDERLATMAAFEGGLRDNGTTGPGDERPGTRGRETGDQGPGTEEQTPRTSAGMRE